MNPTTSHDGADTSLKDEDAKEWILDGEADDKDLGEDNEISGDDISSNANRDDEGIREWSNS